MPSSTTSSTSPSSSKIKPGPMARASVTNPRTPPQTSTNRLIVVRQLIVSPSFERNSLILAQLNKGLRVNRGATISMKSEMTDGPRSRSFQAAELGETTHLPNYGGRLGDNPDSRVGKRRRSIGEVAIPAASADRIVHPWSYDH